MLHLEEGVHVEFQLYTPELIRLVGVKNDKKIGGEEGDKQEEGDSGNVLWFSNPTATEEKKEESTNAQNKTGEAEQSNAQNVM